MSDAELADALEKLLDEELIQRRDHNEVPQPDEYIARLSTATWSARIPKWQEVIKGCFENLSIIHHQAEPADSARQVHQAGPAVPARPISDSKMDARFERIKSVLDKILGNPETPGGTGRVPYLPVRFKFVKRLGAGSFGVALMVFDIDLKRYCVLKVPNPWRTDKNGQPRHWPTTVEDLRERFNVLDEARKSANIRHVGIVTVHAVCSPVVDPNSPVEWIDQFAAALEKTPEIWIEQEYIQGKTLWESLAKAGIPLESPVAASIAQKICEALVHAHKHGIIHRDIKPANILIDDKLNLKIIDFGLAVSFDRQPVSGRGGTERYMSPEQLSGGTITPITDLWSVGVILYEMLVGKRPFERPVDILRHQGKILFPRTFNGSVDQSLSRIVADALDPRTRFQSASDFADALRDWRVEFDKGPQRIPKHRAEEWAQIARERLAQRAQRIMDEQCPAGFPYVSSDLAVVVDREQAVSSPKASELSEEDRVKVLKGEPTSEWENRYPNRPPRYWIQADSGMGKSILLLDAERLIATDTAGRIPIRFGAAPKLEHKQMPPLSTITEWQSKEKVLTFLSEYIINEEILPDSKLTERSDWLQQMMSDGRVVFLLDALDQTQGDLASLGLLFNVEPFSRCPVLLTGRPEPEILRNTVFNAQTWATILVKEFDEALQRTYLGEYADSVLGPRDNRSALEKARALQRGESLSAPADKWRRLCGVPLLLRFIKDLAMKKDLPIEITRESLYAKALNALIVQGRKAATKAGLQPPSPELIDLQLREIAWYMAKMFCRWLGPHYRLPTEAEWEYACRAGTETAFAFGESLESDQANFGKNIGATTKVGKYKANDWGFYDMHGNVWEWSDDGYDKEEYAKYQDTLADNPRDPESASHRLLRGGGWLDSPRFCRCSDRGGILPEDRGGGLGFRVASVRLSQERAGAEPTAQAGREEADPRPTQP